MIWLRKPDERLQLSGTLRNISFQGISLLIEGTHAKHNWTSILMFIDKARWILEMKEIDLGTSRERRRSTGSEHRESSITV